MSSYAGETERTKELYSKEIRNLLNQKETITRTEEVSGLHDEEAIDLASRCGIDISELRN